MSIASEISRISNNVQNTIDAIEAAGVDVPDGANSDNLPSLAQALANTKQDKLTGVEGQVVGFDSQGNAIAQDAPSGLPTGGTTGQILTKTEDGVAWENPATSTTITLTASGWSSNAQTVTVNGVLATGQNVHLSPTSKADGDAWAAAGCWCTTQGSDSLNFTCETVPTQDIELNVEMQEVQS